MKTRLTNFENNFRKFFGLAFPVLITLLLLYAAMRFSAAGEAARIAKLNAVWAEKAQTLLASVRSNHSFEDLVTSSGNRIAKEIESNPDACNKTSFLQLLGRHFNKGFIDSNTFVWFFSIDNGVVKGETAPGLTNSRMRVMQKVFAGLIEFSTSQNISQSQISSHEKFIKSVMGMHSAPLPVGRKREGRLSPVDFEGKRYFLYWRKFMINGRPTAGTIMLFPASRGEDAPSILQSVADRVLEETRHHLAVAFIPVTHLQNRLKSIFPAVIDNDRVYRNELSKQIEQMLWLTDDKGNRVHETEKHLFLRGFLTAEMPYDAVIFAPRPSALKTVSFSHLPAAIVIMIWTAIFIYFYLKNGRFGLPLTFAFRVLFFFSGLLPIFMMLSWGLTLIDESYDNEIYELRRSTCEQLNSINTRSDSLLPLFGHHISEMLKKPELQALLSDGHRDNASRAFSFMQNRMHDLELSLDYLFVLTPGKTSEILLADQRNWQNARTIMNLKAPSVFSINQSFARLGQHPDIILDSAEHNFYKILSSLPNSFLQDSFFVSYEKPGFVNYGNTGRNYYYTVILSRNGKIASYLIFIANTGQLLNRYLTRELASLNVTDTHIYLAAEEQDNSEFTLFSAGKMQIMQTQTGQNALNFLKKCHSSIFEKTLTDRDNLFLFYPMTKLQRYAGGCIISLAGPIHDRNMKRLFLAAAAVLLACLMYVVSSLATSHMLLPLETIHCSLQRISSGNLDARVDIDRQDELGQLGRTINKMVDGFKERLRLGKYVSTTLDRSLSSGLSLEDLKKARVITGTVLFSDIRNFTTLSESCPPAEIAAMLNSHLEKMSEQIQKMGGQVEQFIGDAIVAFFPDRIEADSRSAAVRAALAVYKAHRFLNSLRQQYGQFTYAIGIGLQHGKVIAGSLVTPERCEFSITGEARRQAEEYEALSKLGTQTRIIVSHSFLEILDQENLADYMPLDGTGVFELLEKAAAE